MELPAPSSMQSSPSRSFRSPYRRRRIIWFAVLLVITGLFFAPSSFWETTRARSLVDAGRTWMPSKFGGVKSYTADEELRDLLHMVASSELTIPLDADPSQPLARDVYNVDYGVDVSWLKEAQADPPVIVFSKTYCPYSKKAKQLLGTYDLSPPPKIVEVDLRKDAELLKILLTRLTGHSTFPNVFIEGKSIGGSDDLARLHTDGALVTLLSDAGVSSNLKGNVDQVSPEK